MKSFLLQNPAGEIIEVKKHNRLASARSRIDNVTEAGIDHGTENEWDYWKSDSEDSESYEVISQTLKFLSWHMKLIL